MGVRADIALIKRMQHRVSGTVRRAAGTLHGGAGAEILHMPTERPLIHRAIRVAVKRHAEMPDLDQDFRCFAAKKLDRILTPQPVRTLDGVVHVPHPAVFAHVAERSADSALRGNRMRAGGKNFRQHGDLETRLGELQGRAHAGPAGTDDYRIEFSDRNGHVSETPEDLNSPDGVAGQDQHDRDLQTEAHAGGFYVIHQDVAHAYPGVPEQAYEEDQGCNPNHLIVEQRAPLLVAPRRTDQQDADKDDYIQGHDQRGDALREPVFQPVMGPGDDAFHHSRTPRIAVSIILATNTAQLIARVAPSSPATFTSSRRKRNPAKKWCRNDHSMPIRNSLTGQWPVSCTKWA